MITARPLLQTRRVLWVALIINAVMFLVEIWGGSLASSVSLLADSVDFMGDAANYGISLLVLSMGITWRACVDILLKDEDVEDVLQALRAADCGLAGRGIFQVTAVEKQGAL